MKGDNFDKAADAYCAKQGWTRTGVYANAEDTARAVGWAREVAETPVIKVNGRWLPDDATEEFHFKVDALAQKYKLAEPKPISLGSSVRNHYGLLATGEFVTVGPVVLEQATKEANENA